MRLKFSDDGGRPGAGGFTSRLKGIESGVNHFSRPDFCMSDNFFVCNAGVAMGTIGYSPALSLAMAAKSSIITVFPHLSHANSNILTS
jgi:hypothetical protein